MSTRQRLIIIIIALNCMACSGCRLAGIVSLAGTPGYHEQTVTAEYDLQGHTEDKLAILVEQPAWLDSQINLPYYITRAMRATILAKIKDAPSDIVEYEQLVDYRSRTPDFSLLSPKEIGTGLDADLLLLVMIEDYRLKNLDQQVFSGSLDLRCSLFHTRTGAKLWPRQGGAKSVRVGFDAEGPRQKAVTRLAMYGAFGTVRYLYDCPKKNFKFSDDRNREVYQQWYN